MKKYFAAILGILTIAASAKADLLVAFDFAGYLGSELQGTSTVTSAGINSPVLITRGSGIAASANGDRFNAQGWDALTSADAGLAGGNYFEFTVTPDVGYSLSITQIAFQVQRSNTGASNLVLRTSVDSYTANLNTLNNFVGNNATVSSTYDSSGVTALQDVNGAITFRIIGWTGATAGSTGFEGAGNDIQLWGTAVVPEPASMALMTAGLGMFYLMRRRLRS